jgi:hypothetical protein
LRISYANEAVDVDHEQVSGGFIAGRLVTFRDFECALRAGPYASPCEVLQAGRHELLIKAYEGIVIQYEQLFRDRRTASMASALLSVCNNFHENSND